MWQAYGFGVGVADLQEIGRRLFRLELRQFAAEIVEDLQSSLKHRQTQELILRGAERQRNKRSLFTCRQRINQPMRANV